MPKINSVTLRFYAELNDFLPYKKRYQSFDYVFSGNPSIKDAIEALGIPHTEVDLILVNGISVDFSYLIQHREYISVYPIFESFNITNVSYLRSKPLRVMRFILDVHLGKLAKYLRMLNIDTLYENNYDDAEIISIAQQQKRIILTRDISLLKKKIVDHGYWVRAVNPKLQLKEILQRFDLHPSFEDFKRCLECNGTITAIDKDQITIPLPKKVTASIQKFFQCLSCHKIYWEGTHVTRMKNFLRTLFNAY